MTQRKEGVLKKEKENDYLMWEREREREREREEEEEEEEEEPRNKKECLTMEKSFQRYIRYMVWNIKWI